MNKQEFKTAYSLARALDKATCKNPYESPQRQAFYKSLRKTEPVYYAILNQPVKHTQPILRVEKSYARTIMFMNTRYY